MYLQDLLLTEVKSHPDPETDYAVCTSAAYPMLSNMPGIWH